MSKATASSTAGTHTPPVAPARKVPPLVTLALYSSAGGCCQFRGCGDYLLEHAVTKRAGNFAEQAHIFAFSDAGPRGDAPGRPDDIHLFENLILLCARCHKHIDDEPDTFPVDLLRTFKREHEERFRRAAKLSPDSEAVVLVVTAPVGGAAVAVPRGDVLGALAPIYPADAQFAHIDLSDLAGEREGASFNDLACRKIDREIARLFETSGPLSRTPRIALFAIAPIPILAHLGARLENKIPIHIFQRHRDTQNWSWKTDGAPVVYSVRVMQARPRGAPVALVCSLSGTIHRDDLPVAVAQNAAIYEITLDGVTPAPTFLNRAADLSAFAPALHEALALIAAEHGFVERIDVFPAVPAPIAVLLGRERLMKRHPALRLYDADKVNGGFVFQIEVT